MKRKLLLSLLALIPAALMPLAVTGQVAPDRPARTNTEPEYKWQVYAGMGYTSINHVNQSRHGLLGVDIGATRNWGRYFGVTGLFSDYTKGVQNDNPGKPKVVSILAGPEVHAPLFEHWIVLFHGLLGAEHSGGEGQRPDYSFAGGLGGGLEYQMTPRISIRLTGDNIAAAFTVRDAPPGASTHTTHNGRASIGVGYRF